MPDDVDKIPCFPEIRIPWLQFINLSLYCLLISSLHREKHDKNLPIWKTESTLSVTLESIFKSKL